MTARGTLMAYTPPSGSYPPYFNASRDGDEVVLTIREAPTHIAHGIYVCSHQPGPGNCTPGGPTCNNYCNMAPDKGPMADHPLPNAYDKEGKTVTMRMPFAQWRDEITRMAADLGETDR